jgi:D-3-phosphoglycerate dehydrogenase
LLAEASRFSPIAARDLRALGEVVEFDGDRGELLDRLMDIDVLVTGLAHVIDRTAFERAPALRLIATPTTGLNHIDIAEAERRGIRVVSLRGETEFLSNVTATAELTWALLLGLVRWLPAAHADVVAGCWDRYRFVGRELKGKTLGILGYGRLGRIVADYGRAFRMRVLAAEVEPVTPGEGVELAPLDRVLGEADVVSLHLPLIDATCGWFDADKIAMMKSGALFLNTARGELVDERALVEALSCGRIAGAGVDVLAGEASLSPDWLAQNPVWRYAQTHANLLLTPHLGGATKDSMEATAIFLVEKIRRALAS